MQDQELLEELGKVGSRPDEDKASTHREQLMSSLEVSDEH